MRAHWRGIKAPQAPAIDQSLPVAVVLINVVRDLASQRDLTMAAQEWTLPHQKDCCTLVRGSCLILDRDDASIVGLYLTEHTDAAINSVARAGRQLCSWCPKVYPQKGHRNWYGTHNTKNGEHGYIGHNWLDGTQRFACPTAATKSFVTAFMRRRANSAAEHAMTTTFSGLQALERRHVPAVYAERVRLAKQAHFGGIVPGLPLEDLAGTFVGITLDFACQPHNDSSVDGTTETICWHRHPDDPEFGFTILEYNLTFMIEGASCLYMMGNIWHGTPPDAASTKSFLHNSLGLVLMSKKALLANTDNMRRENENLYAQAVQQHDDPIKTLPT